MARTDIHCLLLNIDGDHAVDVSTVKAGLHAQHFPSNHTVVAVVGLWVTLYSYWLSWYWDGVIKYVSDL